MHGLPDRLAVPRHALEKGAVIATTTTTIIIIIIAAAVNGGFAIVDGQRGGQGGQKDGGPGGLTVHTRRRYCYACGAEFKVEAIPMQESYRGETSNRLYLPDSVQTWCPRGHKVQIGIVKPGDIGA